MSNIHLFSSHVIPELDWEGGGGVAVSAHIGRRLHTPGASCQFLTGLTWRRKQPHSHADVKYNLPKTFNFDVWVVSVRPAAQRGTHSK